MRTEWLSGKRTSVNPRPSQFKAEDFKDPFLPDALGNFEAFHLFHHSTWVFFHFKRVSLDEQSKAYTLHV